MSRGKQERNSILGKFSSPFLLDERRKRGIGYHYPQKNSPLAGISETVELTLSNKIRKNLLCGIPDLIPGSPFGACLNRKIGKRYFSAKSRTAKRKKASSITLWIRKVPLDFRMLTAIQASEPRLFSSSRTFYINTAARWRLWWSQFDWNMYLRSHAISFMLFSFQQIIPERSNQLFYNLTSYTTYEKAHAWIFLRE